MGSRPRPFESGLRHRTAAAFLILFLLGAIASCTDILGITDRTLTSGAGGGGTGGATGGATGGGGGDPGACKTNADCTGENAKYGTVCDTAAGRCVECLPVVADVCEFGLYCDVTKSCAVGCADDADCNPQGQGSLTCNTTTHQCEGCSGSAACPIGSKCQLDTGVCVPGCDAKSECPTEDWDCCNKKCQNVSKDPLNCGACEDPCEPSDSTIWLCLDGGCVFQDCLNGWAQCDSSIAEGNGCETDIVNDPLNCGGCGDKCTLANANQACSNSTCEIASCKEGFGDCDHMVSTGCEAVLATDPEHCGTCDIACTGFANATPLCQAGQCKLGACDDGFGNCDGNADNGCETSTDTSLQHCGDCDAVCALDHATSACVGGSCKVGTCDDNFLDCNGMAGDGCEINKTSDPDHCGSCPKKCSFDNAMASCNMGVCELGACLPGFADCNGMESDGCEVDLETDENNCDACGTKCGAINGTAMCTGGACQIQCNSNFGDCDGLGSNGCETNLLNTVEHCGTCPNECTAGGSNTPFCANGMCGQSNCSANFANCNGLPGDGPNMDGCETNITTVTNCGSCNKVCSSTNGSPSCNGSTCAITCNSGFGNCNNNVDDGCEQQLNTNNHCTGCGVPCARPHAFTSCGTGACLIVSCEQGWADCNNNPSDGCEAELATDENNCGGCGSLCAPPHALGLCVASACTIQSCNQPYANCNGGVADGCEVNLHDDELHCGNCATSCNFPNATSQCNVGVCQITGCNGTFQNCDGMPNNGCEINTATNVGNCGACNNACSSNHGTPSCASSMCGITCSSGYKNCNGLVVDGCEVSTTTLSNCGDCNVICDLPHASESCATGSCQIATCDPGFNNCDGVTATGCECASTCAGGVCQGCGDSFCNMGAGENCLSCPADCACMCGNGTCEPGESCSNCPDDCGGPCCGNGFCQPAMGESCMSCPDDCGGTCCGNLMCEPIYGEDCDTCGSDCGPCGPTCNNNVCESGEDCMNCPADCGVCNSCGNLICEPGLGETCMTCPSDCPSCCGDSTCEPGIGETCDTCSIDCSICMCGDLICNGYETCSTCPGDCGSCGTGGAGASSTGAGAGGGGVGGSVQMDGGVDGGGCGAHLGVVCGAIPCMPGIGCCRPGAVCTSPQMCAMSGGAYYNCDDVTDCTAGSVCCHTGNGGSSCVSPASCTFPTSVKLCTSPTAGAQSCECDVNEQCCPTSGKSAYYPSCQPFGICQ